MVLHIFDSFSLGGMAQKRALRPAMPETGAVAPVM